MTDEELAEAKARIAAAVEASKIYELDHGTIGAYARALAEAVDLMPALVEEVERGSCAAPWGHG